MTLTRRARRRPGVAAGARPRGPGAAGQGGRAARTLLGMGRHLLAGVVVAAEAVLLLAVHRGDPPVWAAVAYPAAVIALMAWQRRAPVAAFAAAQGLGVLSGAGLILLLWISYRTGRAVGSRGRAAAVAAVTVAAFAARLPGGGHPGALIACSLVFAVLPLLVGRYVAQHERLVAALAASNRRLRRERELLAERERLRERLRIARDMHDSLGHRLGLVAIQAAALEVAPLPPEQAAAVRRLAAAARDAVDELHAVVGALRAADEEPAGRGVAAIPGLVGEYRAAGAAVTLRRRGAERPLPAAADAAAYRVVEEGLTNAARHAPGAPVTVTIEWEADALLIEIVNPAPAAPAGTPGPRPGHGLRGLRERVAPLGGLVDHRRSGTEFRLFAMLPLAAPAPAPPPAADAVPAGPDGAAVPGGGHVPDGGPAPARHRFAGLRPYGSPRPVAAAIAALLFVVLPGAMVLGVPG